MKYMIRRQILHKVPRYYKWLFLGVVLLAMIPSSLYALANVFVASEVENGATGGSVSSVQDTSASGSAAVKFGVSEASACPTGGSNVSGAADPWSGCWPGADNSGLPSGTTLATYTGACTISSTSVTINAKDIRSACPGGLTAGANSTVVITNSRLPKVDVESTSARWSISDSDIDGGSQVTYSAITVYPGNGVAAPSPAFMLDLARVNAHGGRNPLECVGSCRVKDSYLHTPTYQDPSGAHQQAILNSGGGTNSNIWVEHNVLSCDNTNGCTADISLFGDFAVASGVTVTKNLFEAHPEAYYYCATFGYNPGKAYPNPDHIVVTNNVFQKGSIGVAGGTAVGGAKSQGKCGQAYPVAGWRRASDGATGNVWSGNTWDDGSQFAEPATSG